MPWSARLALASVLSATFLLIGGPVLAQPVPESDRPARHVPARPATRRELDHREALRLYGLGMVHERRNRLLEAVRTLEEARRLDPDSAAIHKALIPLYVALDRVEDALGSCRQVLEIDPDDYQTGFLYARQLRALNRSSDARAVLARTVRAESLKTRPDLAAQAWFDLAVLSEQARLWKEAEGAYRQVAKLLDNPGPILETGNFTREEITAQAGETWERIGRVCLEAGRASQAIAAYRTAQKKDPGRAGRLAFNLAEVYQAQGQTRNALTALDQYLRTQPQGMEGYELRIGLQRKLGSPGPAIVRALEVSSARDPHNTALRLLLAREYRKARRPDDAERIYGELLSKSAAVEIYRGLFELFREAGERGGERALDRLDRAVSRGAGDEKKPGNPTDAANARAMLVALRGDTVLLRSMLAAAGRRLLTPGKPAYPTRMVLASLAGRAHLLDQAERMYRACLDRPGGLRAMEAEVYAGLLEVLALKHQHAEIIKLGKQGLEKAQETNRVMFHREMARAYLALEDGNSALACADLAVKESGKAQLLGSRRLRVHVLSAIGKHDEALNECLALLKEYNAGSERRDVRATLSTVYQGMGKHHEAEGQMLLILEDDPNDATANNDLGYLWADRNENLDRAEELIRKAIDLDRKQRNSGTSVDTGSDEDNAAYVDSLGWVLFRRGKLDEARRELERAAALPGGDDPVIWDHLGDVCFRQKAVAKARSAWRKALGLFNKGTRRKTDGRYRDIQKKLEQQKP
jgi:tetratricopeptide (TPR) repeat protein